MSLLPPAGGNASHAGRLEGPCSASSVAEIVEQHHLWKWKDTRHQRAVIRDELELGTATALIWGGENHPKSQTKS